MGAKIEAIRKAIAKDSVKAAELAVNFTLRSAISFSLFFSEGVLRDAVIKSGGNPYDNTNTIYTGFSNDWELNKKVDRFKATASPDIIFENTIGQGISESCDTDAHIYDQLIPPQFGEVNFENMVHQKGRIFSHR